MKKVVGVVLVGILSSWKSYGNIRKEDPQIQNSLPDIAHSS